MRPIIVLATLVGSAVASAMAFSSERSISPLRAARLHRRAEPISQRYTPFTILTPEKWKVIEVFEFIGFTTANCLCK
jgi:hypothetical protein